MPDPAITAALITSASSVATTAISQSLKSPSSGEMAGSIENESFSEWVLWYTYMDTGTPNPGMSESTLDALPTPQAEYEAWKLSGDVPKDVPASDLLPNVDDLSDAVSLLLTRWIDQVKISGTRWDTFLLTDNPEYVAVYHDAHKKYAIAIVVDNPEVGPKWCGAIVHTYGWMKGSKRDELAQHCIKHHKNLGHTVYLTEGEFCNSLLWPLSMQSCLWENLVF
ncbi:hypothetical protein DXV75_09335 [Alteromonas aestuariivivens]|uniref:Uncharacterized protein n=1 Tax=Alteromonas aestuariivivens TaxID=1938339 RepID=A0A3D8M6S4_9ALTE|nr:hypothetical protein [Alteromonas aestuariivivens]RDV25492.1 hypothetical protein DXV75_09335 [Alteromonas aestuariivivens]